MYKNYNSISYNKPKGLKVAKEDQRSIGQTINGLDGQQA